MLSFDSSVAAAFLSAIAAIAAALATWRSPISAAKIAEKLRREGDTQTEARRFQLNVFAQIMQGRAEIASEDTVRALNSIDIAFSKSVRVREQWAELYQALNTSPWQAHIVDERMRKLLREMAQELGLAEQLRLDDFGRIYFPNALAQDREMKALQRDATMKQLLTPLDTDQDTSSVTLDKWPPKPSTV